VTLCTIWLGGNEDRNLLDTGSAQVNARTDSLRRGSFKSMLANRRCVIPAEGFYEWREEEGLKQPYFFARQDGKALMFAGIWDYSDVKGDVVPSFAILTDEPNALVAPYHDRMPVILDTLEQWLDVDTKLDAVGTRALHRPARESCREQGVGEES
jgi:putative SOS response-associated peptidase YedK